MFRCAWKAYVLPGKLNEYIRRHDEIWPELKQQMQASGLQNYSIWSVGNELFGYYECEDLQKATANSAISDRWAEYMKDVVFSIEGETLQQVFLFEGNKH